MLFDATFTTNVAEEGKIQIIIVKVPRNRPKGPDGGRSIALLLLDLGTRRGWVVSTTLRQLYTRERPGTHRAGCWVGPRAGLDVCEKSRPHWDFFFTSCLLSIRNYNSFHFMVTVLA
jgi:hypothetical protein